MNKDIDRCISLLRRNGIEFFHPTKEPEENLGNPDIVLVLDAVRQHGILNKFKLGRKIPCAVYFLEPNRQTPYPSFSLMCRISQSGWSVFVCKSFEDFQSVITGKAKAWVSVPWTSICVEESR